MKSLLRISEAAALGLHTMALMAKQPARRLANKDVTEILGCSTNTLAKVMQRLTHADLVNSVRGPNGGFSLARDAATIQILEIYEAVDGPIGAAGCLLGQRSCHFEKCILGCLSDEVNELVRTQLSETTLAELAASMSLG